MRNWRYLWVFNAYPSVDTFFFISAFLFSVFLKDKIHKFSLSAMYLMRYLRYLANVLFVYELSI